jgi:hypothetical protein
MSATDETIKQNKGVVRSIIQDAEIEALHDEKEDYRSAIFV